MGLKDSKIVAMLRKLEELDVSADEYRVLCRIALNTNIFGYCDESNEVLSAKTRICERNITDIVKKLAERKIINVIYNRHKHKRLLYIKGYVEKYEFEPAYEDMTTEQQKFKDMFPDKIVDCDWPEDKNIDAVLREAYKSKFIKEAKGMSLKSFVKYYDLILAGKYTRNEKPKTSNLDAARERLLGGNRC